MPNEQYQTFDGYHVIVASLTPKCHVTLSDEARRCYDIDGQRLLPMVTVRWSHNVNKEQPQHTNVTCKGGSVINK